MHMDIEFQSENLSEGDLQGGRDVYKQEDNIKMDLREWVVILETGYHLAGRYGPMAGLCKGGKEPPGSLKTSQLVSQLVGHSNDYSIDNDETTKENARQVFVGFLY